MARSNFVNGVPMLMNEDSDYCIWRHSDPNNWIIGKCRNVGTKRGFALLNEQFECPWAKVGEWKNAKNDFISGRTIVHIGDLA